MHRQQGGVVVLEVDEPVVSRFAGELVSHDLDGDDAVFAHSAQGLQQEGLVHVWLQLEERKNLFSEVGQIFAIFILKIYIGSVKLGPKHLFLSPQYKFLSLFQGKPPLIKAYCRYLLYGNSRIAGNKDILLKLIKKVGHSWKK